MKYQAVIFDLFGTLVDNISWKHSRPILAEMAGILHAPAQEFVTTWIIDTWYIRAAGEFSTFEASVEHICHLLGTHPEHGKMLESGPSLVRVY